MQGVLSGFLSALRSVAGIPVFLVASGFPGGLPAQVSDPGALQGRIWAGDRSPVNGALVRLLTADSSEMVRLTESDDLGYYHLEPLSPGSYLLEVGRLGFVLQTRAVEVLPGERGTEDFILATRALEVEGIRVEAERSRDRIRFEEAAGITVRELAADQIKSIPGLVEADPLRAVEVLPGVVTTSDFSSAYNVRGGAADQNLILLDGLPVFNPTHLGGFFSVFNADMVERAELQSGGFPARFGGRVSSVLDVKSDPGDGTFRGDAGVSVLATRLALGGGLPGGLERKLGFSDSRWRVSGRRSYFDKVLKPAFEFPYHLTDLQGVFEGWTGAGDRLIISGYKGRDVLSLTDLDPEDFPLRVDWDWGNELLGARWTHPRNDGGWWEIRGGYSRFSSGLAFPDFDDTDLRTEIGQGMVEGDLELRPSPYLVFTSGGGLSRFTFDNLASTGGTVFADDGGRATELSAYLQGEWKPSTRWILELGLRGEAWLPSVGEDILDLSPRLSAKWFLLNSRWAVKASLGRYTQYLHSIRDEELPLGLDVWILAGEDIPRVSSDQLQVGVEGYLLEGWFVSLEGYRRSFDGVLTTNFAEDPNRESDDYLPGTGLSYGGDLLLQRSRGRTTGWLAVSLLRATRSFPDFASGLDPAPEISYPPIFDRRLDVDLVLRREVTRELELGLRWNYGTGLPYTRPLGSYAYLTPRIIEGSGLEWSGDEEDGGGEDHTAYGVILSDRNAVRYPARHRLDVSLRWTLRRGWGVVTPHLSVLNVYNHKNVLFYFYEYEKDPPVRTGISMFPILPSLGVEVTF